MTERVMQSLAGMLKDALRRIERLEAQETPMGFIPLATPATSTAFDGDLYDVDNDEVTVDTSASFGIPAGVKAVLIGVSARCPTIGKAFRIGPSSLNFYAMELHSQVASGWIDAHGIAPCNADGDIYIQTDAEHGAEFEIWMEISGYWI